MGAACSFPASRFVTCVVHLVDLPQTGTQHGSPDGESQLADRKEEYGEGTAGRERTREAIEGNVTVQIQRV